MNKKNDDDDNSLTLSSTYLEPTGDLNDINQIDFCSDIIVGAFNEEIKGLNKKWAYRDKNNHNRR